METTEGQQATAEAVEEHQTTEAIPAEEVLPSLRDPDTPPEGEPAKPGETGEESGEQPRGEDGRFLSTEAGKAPEGEAGGETTETPPAPDATTEESAQSGPPSLDDYEPYSFQADGQSRSIPGTAVGEHGVFFSTESLTWLNQQLATAVAHNGSWQRELTEAREAGQAALQRAEAREAEANKIVEQMQALAQGDPDAAYEWFQNYQVELPVLLAQAENARLLAERDQFQSESERQSQAAEMEELNRKMVQAVDLLVTHYATEYPEADASRVRSRLESMQNVLFSQAQSDAPDGSFRKGEWMVNQNLVEEEFRIHAELGKASATQGKAVVEAGKANQAAVAESAAPPVASTHGTAPAATAKKLPRFKTQKEMDEYYESGAADDWAMAQLNAQG